MAFGASSRNRLPGSRWWRRSWWGQPGGVLNARWGAQLCMTGKEERAALTVIGTPAKHYLLCRPLRPSSGKANGRPERGTGKTRTAGPARWGHANKKAAPESRLVVC